MRPCGVYDRSYRKDMAIVRTWQHWAILSVTLALLSCLPIFASHYLVSFVNGVLITVIVVLGGSKS